VFDPVNAYVLRIGTHGQVSSYHGADATLAGVASGGIIGAVLNAAQRAWLKAFIDFTARQRVRETEPYSPVPRCRGCGIRLSERTPGCQACQSRHAGRRRQARRFAAELRLPSGRSRSARARWANGDDDIAAT
jgi:hypothetical protein